jgi:hypothetical protein
MSKSWDHFVLHIPHLIFANHRHNWTHTHIHTHTIICLCTFNSIVKRSVKNWSRNDTVKINIHLLTILDLSIGYSRSKVVPLHAVTAYGGVEAWFHSFLSLELDKSWAVNFAPRPFVTDKTALGTHGIGGGWAGTNRRYGHSGKHKNISPLTANRTTTWLSSR